MKSLIISISAHHNCTEKIAASMAEALEAEIKLPSEVKPEGLSDYDLVGFGSGIYDQKHHLSLLDLVDRLPPVMGKKVFIFSTSGIAMKYLRLNTKEDPHLFLRNQLKEKGYDIAGEFNCAGFNTNSFLKWFGGMNKGKPDAKDLKEAGDFARNLLDKVK